MLVRKARLQDATNIYELVNSLSRRRHAAAAQSSRRSARTFATSPWRSREAGVFLGCGALHLYGPHLAEVRSIVVKPEAKSQGAGGRILFALLDEAEEHGIGSRVPVYAHSGFLLPLWVSRSGRPDGAAGQDLQRLPELPAALSLRRGGHGAGTDTEDLHSRPSA